MSYFNFISESEYYLCQLEMYKTSPQKLNELVNICNRASLKHFKFSTIVAKEIKIYSCSLFQFIIDQVVLILA